MENERGLVSGTSVEDGSPLASDEELEKGVPVASGIRMENGNNVANGKILENGNSLMSGPPVENEKRLATPLRLLHDTQQSLEKARIAAGNRVSALERGVDEAKRPVPRIYEVVAERLADLESTVDVAIEKELQNWPVYIEWLSRVKGIGPSLAGQLLALLLPPIPEKGPSSWTKAAGLIPQQRPDGLWRLPRPRKGEGKITYHPILRRCLWNVAKSFVRTGGYYRAAYDREKARLLQLHEDAEAWPPIRIDRSARWAMIQLFLAHLWDAWCEAESIPSRGPYGLTTLPDGRQVLRFTMPDGAYQDHVFYPRPLPDGREKM